MSDVSMFPSKIDRYFIKVGFTIDDLKKCVNCMKHGKKEENGIFSNNIIHGTEKLFKALTLLYNGVLIHGVSPSDLLIGTMVPLQKDKRKVHHSSDNYRALTLGSIIGKLYDAIIIKQKTGVFDTLDLQFRFKDGSSTTMRTFMVK